MKKPPSLAAIHLQKSLFWSGPNSSMFSRCCMAGSSRAQDTAGPGSERVEREFDTPLEGGMSRIYVPSRGSDDWRWLLASPGLHWRQDYSAKALADSWEAAA